MNKKLENRVRRMYKLLQEQENNQEQGWIAMTTSQSSDIRELLVELTKFIEDMEESIDYNTV